MYWFFPFTVLDRVVDWRWLEAVSVKWACVLLSAVARFFFFCNCRQKNTHKDNGTTEKYFGLTKNDFKTRYRNHTASFWHTKLRKATELSKHIWTLIENNSNHYILWRILSLRSPYNSANKLLIIPRPELSSLNKRNELVFSCRHRNKTLLRDNRSIIFMQWFTCVWVHVLLLLFGNAQRWENMFSTNFFLSLMKPYP